jgi:hypothetical protein
VLEHVRRAGVDEIIVGGDALPGPLPCETLALLTNLDVPTRFLMGNGDRETLAWRNGVESSAIPASFRETMQWVAEQLSPEEVPWSRHGRLPSARGLGR